MENNTQLVVSLTGSLENGEVFEQTPAEHPLLLVIGQSSIFPEVERALVEMKPGETRSVKLQPEDAYGPHHEDLVHTLELASFGTGIEPRKGMILSLSVEQDGQVRKVPATVMEVKDDMVKVDYNHPLAGKAVIYTLTLHKYLD